MSSVRDLDSCGKLGYPSPQAAWNAYESEQRRRRSSTHTKHRGRRRRPDIYQCGLCHRWHISRGEWGALKELEP